MFFGSNLLLGLPGRTKTSTPRATMPAASRMISSMPANPSNRLEPKNNPSAPRLTTPPRPKPPDLISNTKPNIPNDSNSGCTSGLVRKRTNRSAQLMPGCTTTASARPIRDRRSASSDT